MTNTATIPQRLADFIQRALKLLRLPAVAFGLSLLAVLWWGVFILIEVERSANRRAIAGDTANLSRVFEQNVIRSLSEIDKTLLYLRHTQQRDPLNANWSELIKQAFTASDITFQIAVIDAKGRLIASDRGPQPPQPIDLSDRDHFRVHAHLPGDTIYISKPVLGRVTKQWSVQVTRRLSRADGSFDGVLVASLNPEHFAEFYRVIDLGQGGAVTLVGLDGVVRASGGQQADQLGARLSEQAIIDRIRRESEATIDYKQTSSGAARIASTRWVRGYPLAVVVGTNELQPASSFVRNARLYPVAATGLTLLIAGAMATSLRRGLRLAEARRQLHLKSQQHEVTLENIGQGILMVDAKGEIGFMNARLGELLGLPDEFIRVGHSYRDLIELLDARGEFTDRVDASVLEFIRLPGTNDLIAHYERERPDGTVLEVRTKPLADGGFVRTLTDITGRRRAEAKVLQLARHDALTGLSNRAVFRQKLEEAVRSLEQGGSFAVHMIDLDRFKPVNDTYGHLVGDRLLKEVAQRLREVVRAGDVVGRLGGDEFAIIQAAATRPEHGQALAERICSVLSQPFTIDGHTVLIGASVGISFAQPGGANAQDLVQAADLALYSAKAQCRGTFAIYKEEMHAEHSARRQLEHDLRIAIAENQFELHYQPILSIGSREVTAYEALIRWRHPDRGFVPPFDFIPLAEETGLIGPIGAWVITTACHEMAPRVGSARIAINLSPVQFRDRRLVEIVANALAASGMPAARLEIEITESALLHDDQLTQDHLKALRDLGVHITMDDFGTGYSSLSYLMSYPIQTIKIDRSFVNGLGLQLSQTAIVKTITTLAASLGLSTIAEGVETEEQLRLLRELGCTEAQGYYFSKPLPAADILPPRGAIATATRPKTLRATG